jgi:hypothetical protein
LWSFTGGPNQTSGHERKASTGVIAAARLAGYKPNATPITTQMPAPSPIRAAGSIRAG